MPVRAGTASFAARAPDPLRSDHMRKKAPATRLGDPGFSVKDRAAKYSRFPELKPPDAASALTAEEYGPCAPHHCPRCRRVTPAACGR